MVAILIKQSDRIEKHDSEGLIDMYEFVFDDGKVDEGRVRVEVEMRNSCGNMIYDAWLRQFGEEEE